MNAITIRNNKFACEIKKIENYDKYLDDGMGLNLMRTTDLLINNFLDHSQSMGMISSLLFLTK